MVGSLNPSRRKVLFAVMVSVALHGLLSLAWLTARGHAGVGTDGISTQVDGPDDDESTFVLRDPRPPRAAHSEPNMANAVPEHVEPIVLPPVVITPPEPPSDPGGVTQSGHSSAPAESLPKSGNGQPLHGKLKPGSSVVYLIDRSSSMGTGGRLQAASASVNVSLATLGPDERFEIVAYNGGTRQLGREFLPADHDNVYRAGKWLGALEAEGRSDHRAGFRDALGFQPDVVYLLTDADDLDENETRAIRALVRDRLILNVVIIGTSRTRWETPLERLVHDLGGTVRYLKCEVASGSGSR